MTWLLNIHASEEGLTLVATEHRATEQPLAWHPNALSYRDILFYNHTRCKKRWLGTNLLKCKEMMPPQCTDINWPHSLLRLDFVTITTSPTPRPSRLDIECEYVCNAQYEIICCFLTLPDMPKQTKKKIIENQIISQSAKHGGMRLNPFPCEQ